MTHILAIDPGPQNSGVAYYDSSNHKMLWSDDMDNQKLLALIRHWHHGPNFEHDSIMVIEGMENQGHFVGKTTFETAEWIGRFREAWEFDTEKQSFRMSRRDVKTVMCGGSTYTDPDTGARRTVNDTVVSRAVRARFEGTGGGARPEVGTKKNKGPLYGMKGNHQYSALAIALTWVEIHGENQK